MKIFWQVVVLGVASAAVGLGANAVSPHPSRLGKPVHATAESSAEVCEAPAAAPLREIPRIDLKDATAACIACSAGFVDARSPAHFEAGHITGAVHLPQAGHSDERPTIEKLRGFATIVVYDDDTTCHLAERVAERLVGHGLKDVRILKGTWTAWTAAGGPSMSGACHACSGEHGK